MAGKLLKLGVSVFDAALQRLIEVYEGGDRVVVSFSGGKDSTCVLELCLLAAEATGRLPVEAVTRDEEIVYPGVTDYLDRVWHREDVELHWLVANQPIINAFNRRQPYWWVFDPLLDPEQWVRQPPEYGERIKEIDITSMTTRDRFPVAEGQHLTSVVGLRADESKGRFLSVLATGGAAGAPAKGKASRTFRPIYDWKDSDVWRAILVNDWDYADTTYNTLHRYGLKGNSLRVGPPTMNTGSQGVKTMQAAAKAWPHWWAKVETRLPGARTAAIFGTRVLEPERRQGETWRETFERECIERAPDWIAERSRVIAERVPARHARHSTAPLPEVQRCKNCGILGSWRMLANTMYLGDPFAVKTRGMLPYVEPEQFREGAGTWGGGIPG